MGFLGIGNVVGSVIGAIASKKEGERDRDFNSDEAQKNREFQTSERLAAQEWNELMWNKENEYNSPAQQVQRAMEAGLNPNAIFGNMANSSAPTTSPMGGSQASFNSGLAPTMLGAFSQIGQSLANIRKTESETALNKLEYDWNTLSFDDRLENLRGMNDKQRAEISKIFKDTAKVDFDMDMQERMYGWFANKSELELETMKSSLNLLRNQNISLLKDIELKGKQSDLLDTQIEGGNQENALRQVEVDFCNLTGMPIDTPEQQALFKLWINGEYQRFNDLLTSIGSKQSGLYGTLERTATGFAGRIRQVSNLVKRWFGGVDNNPQHPHHRNP